MDRWVGNLIRCIPPIDMGTWKIIWWGTTGWASCAPHDERARMFANMAGDGVVWFKKTEIELTELEGQGTLL